MMKRHTPSFPRFIPSSRLLPLMGVLTLAIFSLDLLTPLGVADGVLYVGVVLISLRQNNPQFPLWAAIWCLAFTLPGYYLSADGGIEWADNVNRGLAGAMIWVTALMCRSHLQQTNNPANPEKALHPIEEVFETSTDHISIVDKDFRYRRVNAAYERMYNKSREEIVGRPMEKLLGEKVFRETVKPRLDQCFQGTVINHESWFSYPDGKSRYMTITYLPLQSLGREVEEAIVIAKDMTARREAEEALRTNERQLRTILDSMTHFVGIGTAEGVIVDCNRAPLEISGLRKEDVVGKSISETYWFNFSSQVQTRLRDILERVAKGETVREDIEARIGNHTFITVDSCFVPLYDPTNNLAQIVYSGVDVTARRKAENQLKKWATIFQHTEWGIAVGESHSNTLDLVNTAYARMHGYSVEELQGKPVTHVFATDDRNRIDTLIQRVHQEGFLSFESTHVRKDGSTFPVLQTISSINDATGTPLFRVANLIDISELKKTEAELRKSKQDFQDLVNSLEGIVWECEFPSYRFTFVSRQAERLLGYSLEQWLTNPNFFGDHIHEDDRQWALQYCQSKTLQKENHELEYRFLHAKGNILWIKDLVTVVVENDRPVKLRGVMFDLTKIKIAEEDLRKSQERFRKYFATGLVGMTISSTEKKLLEVNDHFCSMLGYSREELQHSSWVTLTHPDDLHEDELKFQKLLNGHLESYSMGKRFLRKDGIPVYTNLYVNAVRDTSGNVEYVTAMIEDITQQKEAEAATRAAERLALATMNALSAQICVLDERGTIIMANEGWEKISSSNGGERERVGVEGNYFSFSSPGHESSGYDSVQIVSHILEVLEGKREEFSYEYVRNNSDTPRWFSCRVTRFANDGPLRVVVAHQNITEQKQAEFRFREAERFTTSILENLPNMVFVKDAKDLRFIRFNKAGEHLLGYSREELIGKNDYDFFPTEEADFFTSKDRSVLAKGELMDIPEEHIHTRARGIRILHTKKVPLYDETGAPRFLLGISEDITEKKLVEEALRTSQSTLQSFFDSAPIMMGVLEVHSGDLRHISDTKATGEFFGKPLTHITGQWCSRLVPQEVLDVWLINCQACLQKSQPVSFEYAHPNHHGLRWVSATVSPLPNNPFAVAKCAYVAQDMTERKNMEDQIRRHAEDLEKEVARRTSRIQELEQRRMQMEKLAALAQVAAGLAHEINNPLASIAQSLVLLKRAIPVDHPKYKYTGKMENCIDRMTHTIEQFYKLYRPTPPKIDPVDLGWVLKSALDIMKPVAHKKGIKLNHSSTVTNTQVAIAPGDLIQVLCNLIHNAVDASCFPSTILVSTSLDQQTVTISISDFGMGISSHVLDQIFDPFFTTKYGNNSAGLGLGLAVSKNLVESMGGRIQCSTIEGKGTTFSVVLPLPQESHLTT